jgi:protein-S-isoprenylcysteine O-methyltransferase Ste14
MRVFDPFAYLERLLPASLIHRLIRAGAAGLFGGFLFFRVRQYGEFALKPLWAAETAIYAALLLSYLVRDPPRARARGPREILVPLAGAALPFALLLPRPAPEVLRRPLLLHGIFWWMTAASLLTAWGIFALRRSFSITVEARELVTSGPYRLVRHPVYLGEMLAASAVACLRFSAANLLLLALFCVLQLWRARMEEEKLARAFPAEYPRFAARSRWFRGHDRGGRTKGDGVSRQDPSRPAG